MGERRRIDFFGRVQGVGFRPFLFRLGTRFGLSGEIANSGSHVSAELSGSDSALRAFVQAVAIELPPQARLERIVEAPGGPRALDGGLRIRSSRIHSSRVGQTALAGQLCPDVGLCPDCRQELRNPDDRRQGHAFISCTNCGPRFTIVRQLPMDRERTSLCAFPLCDACAAEYSDEHNRRFHAQTLSCLQCGPSVGFVDNGVWERRASAAVTAAAAVLSAGRLLLCKGVGGYHLLADAQCDAALAELRALKGRPDKPFAVMVQSPEAAAEWCRVGPRELRELSGAEAPIVVMPRQESHGERSAHSRGLASGVVPSGGTLGLMLPYSPLHQLLLDHFKGPLVVTSANRAGGPLLYDDEGLDGALDGALDDTLDGAGEQAQPKLAALPRLTHNRPIVSPADDPVVRLWSGGRCVLRPGRGMSPQHVRLSEGITGAGLALGGDLKSVFGLVAGDRVILSQEFGDLADSRNEQRLHAAIQHYQELFRVVPEWIASDAHPDFVSTRLAARLAKELGVPHYPVQHHRAHIASCLAEHSFSESAIGVAMDGFGYGDDGTAWGGEFFVGKVASGLSRWATFRPVPMFGGDQASREPCRMALSHLRDAGLSFEQHAGLPHDLLRRLDRIAWTPQTAPATSSVGRWVDAVAALLGVRNSTSYEGQAALELEALACRWHDLTRRDGTSAAEWAPFAFDLDRRDLDRFDRDKERSGGDTGPVIIDTRPAMQEISAAILSATPRETVALRFHQTIAATILRVAGEVRTRTAIDVVALSGGVFQNNLLLELLQEQLTRAGFRMLVHQEIAPGDAGLALGQSVLALEAHRARSKGTNETIAAMYQGDTCA